MRAPEAAACAIIPRTAQRSAGRRRTLGLRPRGHRVAHQGALEGAPPVHHQHAARALLQQNLLHARVVVQRLQGDYLSIKCFAPPVIAAAGKGRRMRAAESVGWVNAPPRALASSTKTDHHRKPRPGSLHEPRVQHSDR